MCLFVTKKEKFRLPVRPKITNLLFFCVFIDVIRKILTSNWNTSWPRISIQRLVRNISSRLNFRSWKQKQFEVCLERNCWRVRPHSLNINVTTRGQRFHTHVFPDVGCCFLSFWHLLYSSWLHDLLTEQLHWQAAPPRGSERYYIKPAVTFPLISWSVRLCLVSELRETEGVTEDLRWLSSGSNVFSKEKKRKQTPENRKLPVHEAAVLEVITVTSDLQLPAGEALPLIKSNLQDKRSRSRAFIQ